MSASSRGRRRGSATHSYPQEVASVGQEVVLLKHTSALRTVSHVAAGKAATS